MHNRYIKLFTGSILLSSILFSGCGESNINNNNDIDEKKPHNIEKSTRTVDLETDWTWFVDMQSELSIDNGKNKTSFDVNFYEGIPSEVKHLQYFLDTDDNASTGFSGSNDWNVFGADYLIEDGDLYKAESKTKWKWKYLGKFNQYKRVKDTKDLVNIKMESNDDLLKNIIPHNSKINVSIEPFDKNWNGTYSTIYPIEMTPKDIVLSYENIIKQQLGDSFINITHLADPDTIIVSTRTDGFKSYTFYNIKDKSNPKKLNTFASENENKSIKWLRVLNVIELEYTVLENEERYKVVYDYTKNKIVSTTKTKKIDAQSLRKQLIEQGVISGNNEKISYLLSPDNKHIFIEIKNTKNYKNSYSLYTYSDDNQITFVKNLKNLEKSYFINNIKMKDNKTLSYTTKKGRFGVKYTHVYNYIDDIEISKSASDKAYIESRIKSKHYHFQYVKNIYYAPDTKHAFAHVNARGIEILWVYDTKNPKSVIKQYTLPYTRKYYYKDIKTLDDNTKISFTLQEVKKLGGEYSSRTPTGVEYDVIYDYINNKEISKTLIVN